MEKDTPFCAFIDAVCAQVRFTPARAKIAEELTAHLEDRAEMLAAHGVPLAEAEERAAAAMGDPVEIGRGLDREHPPFWGWAAELSGMLIGAVLMLFVLSWWIAGAWIGESFDGAFASRYYNGDGMTTLSMLGDDRTICRGSAWELHETDEYWILFTGAGICTNVNPALQVDAGVIYKNPLAHDDPRHSSCIQITGVRSEAGELDELVRAAVEAKSPEEVRGMGVPEILYITYQTDLNTRFTLEVPMEWRNETNVEAQ